MSQQPSVEILHKTIVDPRSDVPLHAQVRRVLRQALDDHFEDGQQFWTETALIQQFKVSQVTVRRALSDLSREGVLERRVAKGSFVRKKSPIAGTKSATFKIGVFSPEWDSPVLSNMLEHLNEICWEEGFRLQVFHTRKGQKVSDAYHMIDYSPQEGGAILFGNMRQATRELFEALDGRGYRTVNIDECMEGYPGAYVGVDNTLGMTLGLDYLAEFGHRRIVLMVNEPEENSSIVARTRAFEEITAKMGLEGSVFHCGTVSYQSSYESAYGKMEELWAARPHPTAIFAVSDSGALAAMRWFTERGIRVPQEVSLLGFDNDPASSLVHPGLSTFAKPVTDIARHAIELLTLDQRGPQPKKPQAIHLPPQLIIRGSTAAITTEEDRKEVQRQAIFS